MQLNPGDGRNEETGDGSSDSPNADSPSGANGDRSDGRSPETPAVTSWIDPAGERITGRQLWWMSLASFAFYLLLGWLLIRWFHPEGVLDLLRAGLPPMVQLAVGLVAGTFAALVIIWFSSRPPLSTVLEDFAIVRVVMNNRFTAADRTQVSISAGVGEEFLFRGAIQPMLGIWLTSFLFIAIHGYFKFTSAGHLLFGVLMFSLSMMLGYLFEFVGLFSAMAAHAVYDLILLGWVDRRGRTTGQL